MSLRNSGSSSPPIAEFAAPDARADGGIRHVRLSRRGVSIERRMAGIKMRLAVPLRHYQAVALKAYDDGDRRLCQVTLVHCDPELTIELYQAEESAAVVTIWHNWAEFFAKPALRAESAQEAEMATLAITTIASPAMEPAHPRRRGDLLGKRRPHFLKRRGCRPLD